MWNNFLQLLFQQWEDFHFTKERTSCRSLFQQIQILSDPCHDILSLITSFIINNQEIFQTNSSIHNINTSCRHHHHLANSMEWTLVPTRNYSFNRKKK